MSTAILEGLTSTYADIGIFHQVSRGKSLAVRCQSSTLKDPAALGSESKYGLLHPFRKGCVDTPLTIGPFSSGRRIVYRPVV